MKISFNKMAVPFFLCFIALNFICSLLGFFNVLFSFVFSNLFLFIGLFFVYVFREPSIQPLGGISSVVAPCDGKIENIKVENGLTTITVKCGLLDKFVKYSPIDGEVTSIVFFSRKHSQFGGGLEIEIKDTDGFKVIITFYSDHWLSNQYKIKSFVSLGEQLQKGTPLTFIPFFCTVKITVQGSSNIMARSGSSLHAGFSHLMIKGLE
jgi:hypothetical protein